MTPAITRTKLLRARPWRARVALVAAALACVAQAGTATYYYDELGRLIRVTNDSSRGTVYKLDGAGNRTSVATTSETVPPSAPGAPSFTNVAWNTATANWGAATDNTAVVAYRYSLNAGATWTALGNTLTTNLSGLSASTLYNFQVQAGDGSGNWGATSSASFTTSAAPDTTAPGAPGTPTFSNLLPESVTASWAAASDNVGVASYEYQLNGGSWTNAGNVLYVGLSGLNAATAYTFAARAKDAAGNTGSAASGSFTTPRYSTVSVLTIGTNGSNLFGFIAGSFGAMNPALTVTGETFTQFFDRYQAGTGQYLSTKLTISGFAANPGQAWLQSVNCDGVVLASAGATFAGGTTATWTWTSAPYMGASGYYNCTFSHLK